MSSENGRWTSAPYWVVGIVGLVLVGFTLGAPFAFRNNADATAMFGLLIVFVTTLISVLATRYYAQTTYHDTLTAMDCRLGVICSRSA